MVACRLNTSAVSLITLPKNAARTLDCSERGNRPVGVSQLRDVLLRGYADADSRDVTNVVRRWHRVVGSDLCCDVLMRLTRESDPESAGSRERLARADNLSLGKRVQVVEFEALLLSRLS